MPQINAYIGFNGDCRKAMEFYRNCIGGNLSIETIDMPADGAECSPVGKNTVMHAALIRGPVVIMGTDMVGPDGYIKGNNVALCLNCDSADEVDTLYSKLSAGGKVIFPLGKSFWGDTFGCFTDKFGITWMVNCHEEQ